MLTGVWAGDPSGLRRAVRRPRQEAARVRAEAETQASTTREEASGHLEAVRAKAAQAAADFETALAKRRQKAEADHVARTNTAERELAETVARTDQLRAEAEKGMAEKSAEFREKGSAIYLKQD